MNMKKSIILVTVFLLTIYLVYSQSSATYEMDYEKVTIFSDEFISLSYSGTGSSEEAPSNDDFNSSSYEVEYIEPVVRRGGRSILTPFKRKYKSLLKVPSSTIFSRSLWVAHRIRTLVL